LPPFLKNEISFTLMDMVAARTPGDERGFSYAKTALGVTYKETPSVWGKMETSRIAARGDLETG